MRFLSIITSVVILKMVELELELSFLDPPKHNLSACDDYGRT